MYEKRQSLTNPTAESKRTMSGVVRLLRKDKTAAIKATYSSLAKSRKFRILYACVLLRNARAAAIRQLNSGEFLFMLQIHDTSTLSA